MEYDYLKALDEFFCSHYTDYSKLGAIEGYRMPELIALGPNGVIERRSSDCMKLCYQPDCDELLRRFKEKLVDTNFTFGFSLPSFSDRIGDRFRKHTFSKLLPAVLVRSKETAESAGAKLTLDGKIWKGIVKGTLYPQKSVLLALALVCRMNAEDVSDLFAVTGYNFSSENVRDVVAEYLLSQKIFNAQMRDRCLAEYRIDSLPIRKGEN